MLKHDRVRFVDEEKNKQNGVLIVLEIKSDYAVVMTGDYSSFGQPPMTVKLSELKRAE